MLLRPEKICKPKVKTLIDVGSALGKIIGIWIHKTVLTEIGHHRKRHFDAWAMSMLVQFSIPLYMYSNRNPEQHVLNCFYCCFLDLHVIYRYHVFSISERKVNKVPKFFPLELVTCNFHFIFLQFSQVWFVLVWTFAAALTVHHLLSPQSTHSPAHPLNAPHPPSLTFHTAPSLLFHLQPPGLLGFCHVSIPYSIFFK